MTAAILFFTQQNNFFLSLEYMKEKKRVMALSFIHSFWVFCAIHKLFFINAKKYSFFETAKINLVFMYVCTAGGTKILHAFIFKILKKNLFKTKN